MTRLCEIAEKIRSKNAGPFWLTLDIFFDSEASFARVSQSLRNEDIADRFQTDPRRIGRFDIAALKVIKVSLPRPSVQGECADRDMHGAAFAAILSEMEI